MDLVEEFAQERILKPTLKNLLHIASPMQDSDNLQRLCLGSINNQV